MFKKKIFYTCHSASGKVLLDFGNTALSNQDIGAIHCKVGDDVWSIGNAQYIPDLAESTYSIFLQIWSPGHGMHYSFVIDEGLFILFVLFKTKAILSTDDIYLDSVLVLSPLLNNDCYQNFGTESS